MIFGTRSSPRKQPIKMGLSDWFGHVLIFEHSSDLLSKGKWDMRNHGMLSCDNHLRFIVMKYLLNP